MFSARLFDDSTPQAPFSAISPTVIAGQIPFCVWTIYGHGELLWEPHNTRLKSEEMNKGWIHNMPGLGPFNDIDYTISKVVGPKSHAPGLAISSDDEPTTTNFALHIPKMTEVVTNYGSLDSTTLVSLGAAVMNGIEEVDKAFDIDYPKESTSLPPTASPADFYNTFKITKDDFWKAAIRKIYMKPNFGEWLRPSGSGQLTRTVADGPRPFPIYGFFIIYARGGSLPESCTLFGAQGSLLKDTTVKVEGHEFPTFYEERVKKYNLISVENRVAVEQKMGYTLRFLDINGNPISGREIEWDTYRHNTDGVIQLLRRVIRSEEITHVEAARIIQALGYNYMLGMDSACNCPGDKVLTQPPPAPVLDSLDPSLLAPIPHSVLAALNETELNELEELRATQEKVIKIVRTVLEAADKAEAEAARAARATEVAEAAAAAAAAAAQYKKANTLQTALKPIKSPAFKFGNDRLLVKTINEATEAVEKAKKAAREATDAAREAARGANVAVEKATDEAREAARKAKAAAFGARSHPYSPPPPPGGGSAKKYSRKRARSRTQKQKRYISRKNKQMKKYAKRHTMRNRRRNTSNKYSSL